MKPLRERYADVWDARSFVGRAGTVERVEWPESDDWRHACSISQWWADCPGQSPAWRHYVMAAVHLRSVEGEDAPPRLRRPTATHEITVAAVDPNGPTPSRELFAAGGLPRWLAPLNVSMQIDDCSDDECRVLVALLAKGLAHGFVPAEPPFPNATREPTWRRTIDATLEHIKLGGHPVGGGH